MKREAGRTGKYILTAERQRLRPSVHQKLFHFDCPTGFKGLNFINYGEGGGYKMEKSRAQNFLRPSPRLGKTFRTPPF